MDNCQHFANFVFRSGKFGPPPEPNFGPRSTLFGKSCQKTGPKAISPQLLGSRWDNIWVPYFQDLLDTIWIILFGNLKKISRFFWTILTSLWLHFSFTFSSLDFTFSYTNIILWLLVQKRVLLQLFSSTQSPFLPAAGAKNWIICKFIISVEI